jgi:hypothetical protein
VLRTEFLSSSRNDLRFCDIEFDEYASAPSAFKLRFGYLAEMQITVTKVHCDTLGTQLTSHLKPNALVRPKRSCLCD